MYKASSSLDNQPTSYYFFKKSGPLACILMGIICILFTGVANAQIKNRNRATTESPKALDSATAIEERLVELAMNGPRFRESEHRNRINELNLEREKRDWVNLLTISANYNDQSFAKPINGAYVYPRYFFGLNIPLGTILSRTDVKAARESIEISKNNQEQLKRTIRAEVLAKYRQFRALDELISLQAELVNDVQAALLQIEDQFRKGTASLELYTASQRTKNEEAAKLINLQLQQDVVEIEIEQMIGTSLESVIN